MNIMALSKILLAIFYLTYLISPGCIHTLSQHAYGNIIPILDFSNTPVFWMLEKLIWQTFMGESKILNLSSHTEKPKQSNILFTGILVFKIAFKI